MDSSIALTWHLHSVFNIVALVGGILFIVWATKLKPAQLKKLVSWLLVIGIGGVLLTSKGYWDGKMKYHNFKGKMIDKTTTDVVK